MARSVDATATAGGGGWALADLFTRLGRELTAQRSIDDVLHTLTRRAIEFVPAAQHAAISRGRDDVFETVAATSDLPPQVDKIQYALGSGPCVDAAEVPENPAAPEVPLGAVFRSDELAESTRWPEFGRQAAEQFGVHSMLSVRLYLEQDDLVAALNLYSAESAAFDTSDETTAILLATHGALALTAARRQDKIDNLELALRNSRSIGMAVGVLMSLHKITDAQAFDLLRIVSQTRHRKIADIAADVVATGALDLPETPEDRTHRPVAPGR